MIKKSDVIIYFLEKVRNSAYHIYVREIVVIFRKPSVLVLIRDSENVRMIIHLHDNYIKVA